MPMPSERSLSATPNIKEKYIAKRAGARTQPCFVPLLTSKSSDNSPSRAFMPSWREVITFSIAAGMPALSRIFQCPPLETASKAFVRSTKTT